MTWSNYDTCPDCGERKVKTAKRCKPCSGKASARPVEDRLWPKVVEADSGCWLWQGCTNDLGYGQIWDDGRLKQAHRVAYELVIATIPQGLELDHLCRNPTCVNPAHLEPVTHLENIRRGSRAQKTHCLRGHPLSGANLSVGSRGSRQCRECCRIRERRRVR